MVTKRIWAVRAGRMAEADHLFLNRQQLAIAVSEVGRDASLLEPTRAAFKESFGRADLALKPGSIPVQAGQLFRFVHEMRIGDFIVYPRKSDRTVRWGEVAGAYAFDAVDGADYPHRRPVRWRGQMSRDAFSQGALYELGSVLTLFEIKTFADEFFAKFEASWRSADDVVETLEDETASIVARDIAETTKDFISKTLKTELKGFLMEAFIADLFRAMNYRARETRSTKDDGVDIIAHRDELGIEPPVIKIQVKSQDGNVSADAVKAFYANIHDREVGVFVTTGGFTAAALDFHRNRSNLRLIAGVELMELIQRHYDRLSPKFRQIIPLRRVLVPDVARDDD